MTKAVHESLDFAHRRDIIDFLQRFIEDQRITADVHRLEERSDRIGQKYSFHFRVTIHVHGRQAHYDFSGEWSELFTDTSFATRQPTVCDVLYALALDQIAGRNHRAVLQLKRTLGIAAFRKLIRFTAVQKPRMQLRYEVNA
jgi:hypothetical protein